MYASREENIKWLSWRWFASKRVLLLHLPNLSIPQTNMMAPLQRARNGAYPEKQTIQNELKSYNKKSHSLTYYVPFINLEKICWTGLKPTHWVLWLYKSLTPTQLSVRSEYYLYRYHSALVISHNLCEHCLVLYLQATTAGFIGNIGLLVKVRWA